MWLLVIGGIIGYLLIGFLIAGILLRCNFIVEEYSDNGLTVPVIVFYYPFVLPLLVVFICGTWIIERISGKDA